MYKMTTTFHMQRDLFMCIFSLILVFGPWITEEIYSQGGEYVSNVNLCFQKRTKKIVSIGQILHKK